MPRAVVTPWASITASARCAASPGWPGIGGEMDVHVDQAGHQRHAARVDPAGAGGDAGRGGADRSTVMRSPSIRTVWSASRSGAGHRQYVGADDGGDLLGLGGDGQEQGEKRKKQA